MPKPENNNNSTSLFFKSESSFSSDSCSNYTGIGARHITERAGTFEGLTAFRASDSTIGGFQEFRYTTPEFGNSDLYVESKSRLMVDDSYDGPVSVDVTEQLALKGSWNLGNGVGLYEIAGATSRFSLQGNGVKSVGPISITGLSYNPTPKVGVYGELVLSKPYDMQSKAWKKLTPSGCLGVKVVF
jgi:hypothetical protein